MIQAAFLTVIEASDTCDVQLSEKVDDWMPDPALVTCETLRFGGRVLLGAGISKLIPMLSRGKWSKLDLSRQAIGDNELRMLAPAMRRRAANRAS